MSLPKNKTNRLTNCRELFRNRLYLQIYMVFFIGIIVSAALIAGILWKNIASSENTHNFMSGMTELVSRALPQDAPQLHTETALKQIAKGFDVELTLYQEKQHVASSGEILPFFEDTEAYYQQQYENRSKPIQYGLFSLKINAGRTLIVHHQTKYPTNGKWAYLLLLMVIFALIAYPISKRLTSRLERLTKQMEAFGRGDLSARVAIKGKDEIAILAQRFNTTAAHVEQLIEAQKHILLGASHELRSPLTRMRLAVELMNKNNINATQQKLSSYIAELDALVGELLFASKLEAGQSDHNEFEKIDLLGLVAEEACHYEAEVSGQSALILGNEHMLRRMLRNLLQNAQRHQVELPISISVKKEGSDVLLSICDDGPGIEEVEQKRIFEPFYQARSVKNQSGTIGLGLSLVHKIVKQHQGAIQYKDQPTTGACFEIALPQQAQ